MTPHETIEPAPVPDNNAIAYVHFCGTFRHWLGALHDDPADPIARAGAKGALDQYAAWRARHDERVAG